MKKILVVIGTRPEAIKMAPVVSTLKADQRFNTKLCTTGQHSSMLDYALKVFSLSPDYKLSSLIEGQTLVRLSARLLQSVSDVIDKFKPDIVLVHGDTATTVAASMAAYLNKCLVGHIEAGLRTHNLLSPWPEEGNRRLTASITTLHFAPTQGAAGNLINEGVPKNKIFVTGNTVVDALLMVEKLVAADTELGITLNKKYATILQKQLILITTHRRENYGSGFENICSAIRKISEKMPSVNLLLPVHPNPAVKNIVEERLGSLKNVYLIEPLDYHEFVFLMSKSSLILTDSGGIQEEAPTFGVPVLVMREATERPEAVNAKTARLVGTDPKSICENVFTLLTDQAEYLKMSATKNPFGNGDASEKIQTALANFLC